MFFVVASYVVGLVVAIIAVISDSVSGCCLTGLTLANLHDVLAAHAPSWAIFDAVEFGTLIVTATSTA